MFRLDSGVPQGSVLGPLPFAVYVSPVSAMLSQFRSAASPGCRRHATLHRSGEGRRELCCPYQENRLMYSLAVRDCFLQNDLQLHSAESDLITIGTVAQRRATASVGRVKVAVVFR